MLLNARATLRGSTSGRGCVALSALFHSALAIPRNIDGFVKKNLLQNVAANIDMNFDEIFDIQKFDTWGRSCDQLLNKLVTAKDPNCMTGVSACNC